MEQLPKTYNIYGRITERITGKSIAELKVEAWDKDLFCNDIIGSTQTNEKGYFELKFDETSLRELFLDKKPDLFFRVFREDKLIRSTETTVLWNIESGSTEVNIEVNSLDSDILQPVLKINSLDELSHYETEILERIANFPNGGNLFLIHPFLLLNDVGVELSEQILYKIVDQSPHLSSLSATPYNALKYSQKPQSTRIHLKGLFQKRST